MDRAIYCIKCSTSKSPGSFYHSCIRNDGKIGRCKVCVRSRVRAANNQPHRVKYFKSRLFKIINNSRFKAYSSRHPGRHDVRMKTNRAIKKGLLVRPEYCQICNSKDNIEAHHDDYNKAMSVRWLCRNCHRSWHCENKPIYINN